MTPPGFSLAAKSFARGLRLAGGLAATLLALLIGAAQSSAQNINWVGGTSTDWNTPANWDLSVVPGSSNNVTVDINSGNQPVISTGTLSVSKVTVGNTTASGLNTALTIQGGAQVSPNVLLIGNATGSSGSVLVTGNDTELITSLSSSNPPLSNTQVGVNGTASLTIANGAEVIGMSVVGNLSASNGTVLVTGDGSLWNPGHFIYAGLSGVANITIADGGNGSALDLMMEGKNSSVTVTGVAASGNHSNISLTDRFYVTGNNESLTIANGGQLSTTGGVFLSGNSNNITVTDSGSTITAINGQTLLGTYGFYIGIQSSQNDQLTIANGASLTSSTNYIGYSANTTGGVAITGNGSVWNANGNVVLGNATNSTGSLTLANGGSINLIGGNIILGQNSGNGTLNLNDGSLFQYPNSHPLTIGGAHSAINWGGGDMQATANFTLTPNMTLTGNGCTFDSNGFNVTFSGFLSGNGTLTKNGNGVLNLNTSTSGGSTLFYTGNTTINAGSLNITTSAPRGITLTTNITDNANLSFGGPSNFVGNYTGVLSGNGTLSIEGNVTMTGTNTFTGNIELGIPLNRSGSITFNGDMSQMGGTLNANTSIQLNILFAQNFDTSYAGNITGNASILKSGSGNLTLSGILATNYTFPGLEVNSGTVIIANDSSQFQGTISIAAGANLIFNQTADSSLGNITLGSFYNSEVSLSGSGNLIKNGNATLTLAVIPSQGNIIINSGTLVFVLFASGSSTNIFDNSTLVLAPIIDGSFQSPISGTGAVAINATGNITFSAVNTYTGNTTINSGTLLINGQLAAASNVTVNTGTTLGGNGTVLGPITVNAGGMLAPGCALIETFITTNPDGSTSTDTEDGLFASGSTGTGTLSVNTLSLDPAATLSFALSDPGNYSNLSVTGSLAEAGSVVININSGLKGGTYQLISSTGGLSNDFNNVSIAGLYSATLTDNAGVWTGGVADLNFTFNATTGQLVVAYTIVPLNPAGTTTFSISDTGHYTNLTVAGDLAEAGNLVLNLSNNLHTGTYQLLSSDGGLSNDFSNVTLAGLYSTSLTDSGGVWSGNVSGATFTFNAATGQLVISTPLPAGISATKAAWLEQYFTVPQLLDATISGDNASPAGDGISNLLKYALNLNPLVDGHAGLPQINTDGVYLYFFFVPYQSDINYNIEASIDLVNWSSDGVDVYPYDPNLLVGSYPVPASGTVFFQLVVSPISASPDLTSSSGYTETLTSASLSQLPAGVFASWAQQDPAAAAQWAAQLPIGARGSSAPTNVGPPPAAGGRRGAPPPPALGQP